MMSYWFVSNWNQFVKVQSNHVPIIKVRWIKSGAYKEIALAINIRQKRRKFKLQQIETSYRQYHACNKYWIETEGGSVRGCENI